MPKNSKNKTRSEKRNASGIAMQIFTGGCAAEIYLLAVLRYCVNNGALRQMLAWDAWLLYSGWIGLALLAAGLALFLPFIAGKGKDWRKSLRRGNRVHLTVCAWLMGLGLFLMISGFGGHSYKSMIRVLSVAIPAAMLLYLFWTLYDRECALALTLLGGSLVMSWVCCRAGYALSPFFVPVKAVSILYLAALCAVAWMLWKGRPWRLLPKGSDPASAQLACALSAAGMLASIIGPKCAYYAMWSLALAAFGFVVFFTVKQL